MTLANIKATIQVFRVLLQCMVIRWQVFSVEGGPWQTLAGHRSNKGTRRQRGGLGRGDDLSVGPGGMSF